MTFWDKFKFIIFVVQDILDNFLVSGGGGGRRTGGTSGNFKLTENQNEDKENDGVRYVNTGGFGGLILTEWWQWAYVT